MNSPDLKRLLDRVNFKDWTPVMRTNNEAYLVWWTFRRLAQGEFQQQWTRKWYVSRHATESEVVQTLLLAALQAVEHEAREDFRIDGVQAYRPHINVYALKVAAKQLDLRKEVVRSLVPPTPIGSPAEEVQKGGGRRRPFPV